MKKLDLTGYRYVFSFTLMQTLKSKAYRITFIILILLALLSVPVISLVMGNMMDSDEKSSVEKLYIFNETQFEGTGFEVLSENAAFSGIEQIYPSESYDEVAERIKTEEQNAIIARLISENGAYFIELRYSGEGDVGSSECSVLGQQLADIFSGYKLGMLELSEEQTADIFSETLTDISVIGINAESGEAELITETDTSISDNEYWFVYVVLFVVLMVNVVANSSIASAIVEDKASRVVEYLLTSIRPLAIITGKILAMLVAVVMQMLGLAVAALVSSKLSGIVLGEEATVSPGSFLPGNLLENLNPLNVIISLLVIVLGLTFYASLAGIAGAMASRAEELNDTLSFFTILNLAGAYIGMGAAGVLNAQGENAFSVFALICPISSPFLLPGAIFVGKVSLVTAIIAIAVLIISNFLVFKLVAGVYESLILHMGNPLKIKDVLKIATRKEVKQ